MRETIRSGRAVRDHAAVVADALARDQAARSPVVASWARSASHGLVPARGPRDRRLSGAELTRLREQMEPVTRAARPAMAKLFQAVGGFGASVLLANSAGVPFERLVHSADDQDFADAGLSAGTDWSEFGAGTNGIGTSLAEGKAVVIRGDQHFLASNTALTCASAPVFDAVGELVAVLDVSTVRRDIAEAFAGLLSHSVQEAARRIEADLFHACYPKARVVMVPGAERGPGALLAVDADDLVIGASRAARLSLGLSGDLRRNPVPAGDLLGLDSHHRPEDGEKAVLARAIARSGGNLSAAARALGISRATLHRKMGPRS